MTSPPVLFNRPQVSKSRSSISSQPGISPLTAVASTPVPMALVRISISPGLTPRLEAKRSGSTTPDTASPYLISWSSHAVPAAGHRARRLHRVLAAAQDFGQHGHGQPVRREADDVHGSPRFAAHGVDVGQGVGRRDAAEAVGIVDHRGEEIHGLDQGLAGRKRQNCRVLVVAGASGEYAVVGTDPEARKCDLQVPWSDLRRSARGFDHLDQFQLFHDFSLG